MSIRADLAFWLVVRPSSVVQLQRGEKLDVMETRSSTLLSESKKFEKYGKWINLQALYKTYGPVVAVVLVVLFIIYIRFFR